MLRIQVNDENDAYSSNIKQINGDTPSIKKKGLNIVSPNAVKHQSCFDIGSKINAENSLLDCPTESYFPSSDHDYSDVFCLGGTMEDVFVDIHKIAGSWRPNRMAANICGTV
ncbi:unnamed protein product [Rodentolepis nana]|uniref:Peptidase S1 domain-containing protein n=1 Tax=Rodentolepis nana TaxID=102285 RepID=A0A0R3T3P6_RODNA|nr:unnamed protein product [Rodentolepis nana]